MLLLTFGNLATLKFLSTQLSKYEINNKNKPKNYIFHLINSLIVNHFQMIFSCYKTFYNLRYTFTHI